VKLFAGVLKSLAHGCSCLGHKHALFDWHSPAPEKPHRCHFKVSEMGRPSIISDISTGTLRAVAVLLIELREQLGDLVGDFLA
jgi:nitrate reductase beta subunit